MYAYAYSNFCMNTCFMQRCLIQMLTDFLMMNNKWCSIYIHCNNNSIGAFHSRFILFLHQRKV